MPEIVHISKENETYIRIKADRSVLMELWNHFCYDHPKAPFTPAFKEKRWDGKVRLLDLRSGKLPLGLHLLTKEFCEAQGYEVVYDDPIDVENSFSVDEFRRMIKSLKLSVESEGVRDFITPHDYQERGIIHAIQASRSLLLSATACHAAGTEVIMFNGTTKKVEDVVTGDLLMGPDSTPRTVSKLYRGQDEMFDVVPKDKGDTFRVNSNHILSLVATNQGRGSTRRIKNGDICNISVAEYLTKTKTFKHIHKLYRSEAISFPGAHAERPIESYFLGVLLGDGGMSGAGVSVTTIDDEIVQEIYRQAEKFIPFQYKVGSIEDRLQLLAGIIDTDGSYANNSYYEISTKSLTLANDIAFVARSLGFYSSITDKVVKNVTYYRINVCGDIQSIPVKIARKKAVHPTRKKTLRTGFDVYPVGKNEYFGFELDGDHLYLLKDFTVTHNSGKSLMIYVLVRYFLAKMKGKILIIVPNTSLVRQLYDDFTDYSFHSDWDAEANCHMIYDGEEKHTDKRVTISTWQALAVKERLPKEILDELKAEKTPAQVRAIVKKFNKQAPYVLEEEFFHQFKAVFGDECLHPETNISMADGSLKQIQHVQPGDEVLTFNEQSKQFEKKPVVKQHLNISKSKQMFNLTLADGTQLQITGNHKVKLRSGLWKRVDELVENDDIINIGDPASEMV